MGTRKPQKVELGSARAYARARGVDHKAVLKAIRAGRIKRRKDGKIDFAKADAAVQANRDPARPSKLADAAGGGVSSAHVEYAAARAAAQRIKTEQLQARLERERGEWLRAADVSLAQERRAHEEKLALLAWPSAAAPEMAAVLGCDARRLARVLDERLRIFLEDRSGWLAGSS